jgi:hypothetical protein
MTDVCANKSKKGGWSNPTFKIWPKDRDKQMNESVHISFDEAGRLLGGLTSEHGA